MNLAQMIRKTTRITSNFATLSDLIIITNKPEIISDIELMPSPIADHELIYATLKLSKRKRQPVYQTSRCLKNYNPNHFLSFIRTDSLLKRYFSYQQCQFASLNLT